jgi:hypothetical protein
MENKMSGTVTAILNAETGKTKAGKEWKKGGFVINNGDQYNPNVAFTVFGEDKINEMITFKPGDQVEVSFNLSSREHNGKWYHSVDAWRVQVLSGAGHTPQEAEVDDDLPF